MVISTSFWRNKKVLVTGHTGFKGSWLSLLLNQLEAEVFGYALDPSTSPSMFELAMVKDSVHSYIGDIRDYDYLYKVMKEVRPEIVIHMAAQALVKESYRNPIETYSTNVMGTVHLLEACRQIASVKAIVNVTTDKCYENREWYWGYRENEPMGGHDPYSSSKGCSELVTSAYRSSYFGTGDDGQRNIALASVRAGNVIGGGDWAADRLIPDFIRAISQQKKIMIRSPYAIRPWQHVLEPLSGYLILAEKLFNDGSVYAGAWNFGPNDQDAKNVEWITRTLCELWGDSAQYEIDKQPHPHEANYLKLDCSKAKAELAWFPRWDIQTALESIVEWNKISLSGAKMRSVTDQQIRQYFSSIPK
ncbi:MAG: CDP-glucose 4,6-dehydratase [Bacteroidetes bacterium]|jgi:CDP-glucose 4,6-dehydratase|nr:CDP-glucose 4,6-dehydratase [Bacteroidota bacterium]